MLSLLLLAEVFAIHPARELTSQHPGISLIASADPERLVHASGFLFESGAMRPEDAAAAFLGRHGAAFGVSPRQGLVLQSAPAAGEAGAVRYERTIDGLPVFDGGLVVGVDARNRVFVVNSADVPPAVSGRHMLGEAAARSAAVASFPNGLLGAGPASVAAGWRAVGPSVRAVYRVDVIAGEPAGDWRVSVDGETGLVLFREDLRDYAAAQGSVYEVSPVETASSICPISGTGHTFCATPVTVTFPNLSTGADLTGTQSAAYDCKGADAPTSAAAVPGVCAAVPAVGGAFEFGADATFRATGDDFAAAMAYYHLDKHVSFLKGLDPTIPPAGATGGSSRALRGSLPALVNAFQGGAPLENAFFSGLLDAMVFGQGTAADYAYDATIMYHELTHGAVFAWGGFNVGIDSLGGLWEPKAVNEGTADALAVSEIGRSQVGSFVSATTSPAQPFMRDLNDPSASRTCHGDGTRINQFGTTTPFFINGRDGEEHDDGQIWSSFYWEVYQGLRAAGLKGCGGACDAGPALQYKTVQLAGGTSPTLSTTWQTMKSAATALFPAQSGAPDYVDCVAKRRRLDQCDITVPVYAGESKLQLVQARFSPFQVTLLATGATQLHLCSGTGVATTAYVRMGQPAQITAIDSFTGAATVTADASLGFSQPCKSGMATLSLPSAGTWYVLLDSPNALPGATPGYELYRIDASTTGTATRPPSTAPPTCAPPYLAVSPAAAVVPPRGNLAFTASGGSGEGYVWSLTPSASGASLSAAGVYSAGSTASVTDALRVTDSLGNTATRAVQVGAALSVSPATASTATGGRLNFSASGGSGTGLVWSLATNASGGSIGAGGDYTAGPKSHVTDVVLVTDSLGNSATRDVTIGARSGCGYGSSGGATSILALGLAAWLGRRRRRGARASRAAP